jgi:phytoene dehydrogenase-like protein
MASTRRKVSQREVMGHIKGNLQLVVDTLQNKIQELGGAIFTNTVVENIAINKSSIRGVTVEGERTFSRCRHLYDPSSPIPETVA